jgi:hypothetical protein
MSSQFISIAYVTMVSSLSGTKRKAFHNVSVSNSNKFRHDLIKNQVSSLTCYSASYNLNICPTNNELHVGTPMHFRLLVNLLSALFTLICAFVFFALVILNGVNLPV